MDIIMTEKIIKYSKIVIQSGCWILKQCIPESPIQGLIQDALDECAGSISDELMKKMTISKFLEDEFLEELKIPESQYEIVRHSVKRILENTIIEENMLGEEEYEISQVVDYLWNRFCEKDEYNWEEKQNIKKVLYQIVKEVFELLIQDRDFLISMLSKVQKLANNMEHQKKQTYELREKICELEKIINQTQEETKIKLTGKEIKYQKNWELPLFLNKREPKICLKDIYMIPDYYLGFDYKNHNNNLNEVLNDLIIEKTNSEMLLVLGKPGSGKSSLITYIINQYVDKCKKKFLVFPVSTLKNIEWNVNNANIAEEILNSIGVSDIRQLNKYVLILDGFDEILIHGNRENIINQLYEEWVNNVKDLDFSLIITCRENYLQRLSLLHCKVITLCLLNEKQIESFCKTYWRRIHINKHSENYIKKLCSLRDIVGIPLILYMTVALNVNIIGTTNICDIYDKIFCLDDGIYDRCEYSAMGHPLTSPLKKQIHNITKQISIKMWTDNPEEAFILQRDYEKLVDEEDNKSSELKNIVLIGQYFQYVKYCEGIDTEEIRFVHRSIYEYFIALTIYDIIKKYLELPNENFAIKELKKHLLILLQKRQLSIDIEGYLAHKIKKTMDKNIHKEICYEWWKEFFSALLSSYELSIEDLSQTSSLKKIDIELVTFINMLSLMRMIAEGSEQKEPYCIYNEGTALQKINGNSPKECMEKYIRYVSEAYQNKTIKNIDHLDLSKLMIKEFQLNGINLSNTNLSNTDLRNSNLNGANLRKSNLSNAMLQGCDLRIANLSSANLEFAKMQNIKLLSANLSKAIFLDTYMSKRGLSTAVYKELAGKKIIWTEE